MQNNLLKWISAIPKMTRILAKSDVQVRYQGEGAYTTVDKTGRPTLINLPALNFNSSNKQLDLTFGFMFHELGHVNYTDFQAGRQAGINMKSGLGQLFNLIEDVYIEKEVGKDFLEAKRYLSHCRDYLAEVAEEAYNSSVSESERKAAMLVAKIRSLSGQNELDAVVAKHSDVGLDYLDKFADRLQNINSTKDSIQLAKEIYQEIKQDFELPQNGNDSQDGNTAKDNGDGSGEGSGVDKMIEKAINNSDAFKDVRAKGTEDKTNKMTNGDSGKNKPQNSNINKKMRDDKYVALDRSQDKFYEIRSRYDESTEHKMLPQANVAAMKQKLIRLLKARERVDVVKGKRSGKLCGSNLFRLRLDDDRVFQKKFDREKLNVAITLLVDCSGSMYGSRIQCAVSSAYLFSKVLESINIKNEVLGFSTSLIGLNVPEGRDEAIAMNVFKSFDEKLTANVVGRFCSVYNRYSDDNYFRDNDDGESILMALTHLEARPEQRKIIFVLSDGQPNVGGCRGEEIKHAKDVIQMIEKDPRYEIYGIGIQTDYVRSLYKNYSVLDNPNNLSQVVINHLSKTLL